MNETVDFLRFECTAQADSCITEVVVSKPYKDFLRFECTAQADSFIREVVVSKPYNCKYFEDFSVELHVKALGKQARLNLIKESIRLNKLGLQAFWHTYLDETEAIKRWNEITAAHPELSKNLVACSLDEFASKPVLHGEKYNELFKLIADKLSYFDAVAPYTITPEDFINCDITIEPESGGIWFSEEGDRILTYLESKELIKKYYRIMRSTNSKAHSGDMWMVSITIEGWGELSHLNTTNSKAVFIAMAFSAWEKPDEKQKLISAIQKACARNGFEANIVSGNHTDNITDKIISEIKRAKFVICDFTYNNQGVYFEAGYARALGKNVYHLVRTGEHFNRLHFDIKQINCRTWDNPEDVEQILYDWIGANE
jgi:hypothetical protein